MKKIMSVAMILVICFLAYGQYKKYVDNKNEQKFENSYIKLNISELNMLLKDQAGKKITDGRYLFRGMIYRDPKLNDAGYFGVMRIVMVCCAADTIATGFRIPVRYLDKDLKDGQWVKVFGHVKRTEKDYGEIQLKNDHPGALSGSPISLTVRNDYIFIPDKIIKTEKPENGYIFFMNQSPPFYY